jgi:hypothetical protein
VAGDDPQVVAVESGGKLNATIMLGRTDTSIPQPVREAAFRAPRPGDVPVVDRASMVDGSDSIILLTKVIPGDAENLDDTERQIFREDIIAAAGGAELAAYVEQLRSQATVVISAEQFQ